MGRAGPRREYALRVRRETLERALTAGHRARAEVARHAARAAGLRGAALDLTRASVARTRWKAQWAKAKVRAGARLLGGR